jgi:hypothetical protein
VTVSLKSFYFNNKMEEVFVPPMAFSIILVCPQPYLGCPSLPWEPGLLHTSRFCFSIFCFFLVSYLLLSLKIERE